ncbi:MAG: hypothetical protein IH591_14410 [Bacteroidales bacterium]|nr:hypothetical protein [Bacteroidales bacterium]
MELFLLVKNRDDLRSKLFSSAREEFFESDSVIRDVGNYKLYLNRKTLALSCSSCINSYGSAYGTGTFIYRLGDPEESLQLLLNDFIEGRFDHASLLGHYFIFLFLPSGIKILTDGTGLVKAYHDTEGSYLSSSFLLAARLHKGLTLNRAAATENLVTGGITGTETLVNEISTLSKASFTLFPDIEFVLPRMGTTADKPASEADAIRRQAELLGNYFSSCANLAAGGGADIGLTGGYDSRLVLACARDHIHDLQIHSHYRTAGSEEWRIARRIAEGEQIAFVSPEVTPPEKMDDEMLLRVIGSSFRFSDGAISLHCNWMEEYNSLEYGLSVLGDKRLGFSGIGGEQYRNQERLYGKPWLFSQWLKYSYLRKVSGRVFLTARDERAILERIKSKIFSITGFRQGKRFISLADLKRIQNEVLIPAYRGARTDAGNRHAWYLSPLADFHVSTAAYGIIEFLKDSKRFEADLIRMIAPSLAVYPTDYGYNLVRGEPLSARIIASVYENLLPASLKWAVREKIRRRGRARPALEKIRTSRLLRGYVQNVSSAGLPVSIPDLLKRESTAHMVISLGYILEKLEIAAE